MAAAPTAATHEESLVRIVEPYEDEGGKWRWRVKARNGKKVAVSGESFDSKGNCERAIRTEFSHRHTYLLDGEPIT